MNIHELKTVPVERIHGASADEVRRLINGTRKPLIFSGIDKDFEFLKEWDLDFFSKMSEPVPVQQPEPDGVNYFVKYFRMPMADFARKIAGGEKLYIGAREIMSRRGKRSDKDGLGDLQASLKLPAWIDPKRIWSANLWVGAGDNRTLLHFDPWDSILLLGQGEKEFLLFPEHETHRMAQVGALSYKELTKGAVLHSRIKPLSVQPEYQEKFSKAEGFRGTIQAGEVMYVPAGFWHYVESSGLNIGINFFLHFEKWSLNLRDPLRTYWFMDNITLWPIRAYQAAIEIAGNFYHRFVPREKSTET